jgi:hypothetical protein
MIPVSTTSARGPRSRRARALLLALLHGLWLAPATAQAAEAELAGSSGSDWVAIDIGHGVTLPEPADHYAATGIGIDEQGGRPCRLTLWGRTVDPRAGGERELAVFELGGCRGTGGRIDAATAGFGSDHRFLRALRVCRGPARLGPTAAAYSSLAWQIKGLMVQPAEAAATVEALPDLDSFTRPECPKRIAATAFDAGWSGWSTCPAGQLMTGLRAHYSDDGYFTGLSVRCKGVAWRMSGGVAEREIAGR